MNRRLALFSTVVAATNCLHCRTALAFPVGEPPRKLAPVGIPGVDPNHRPPPVEARTREESNLDDVRRMKGCALSAAGAKMFGSGQLRLLNRLPRGLELLNAAIMQESHYLPRVSGLSPGFAFFEDASPNAFATPEQILGRPDGSVIFGVNLVGEQLGTVTWWGAAIAGIMAHEWGHIAQFASNTFGHGKVPELQADVVAGWYLGHKHVHRLTHVEIDGLARSLFSKGDANFNSRDHHGTPRERVQAMDRGYKLALTRTRSTFDDALTLAQEKYQ